MEFRDSLLLQPVSSYLKSHLQLDARVSVPLSVDASPR